MKRPVSTKPALRYAARAAYRRAGFAETGRFMSVLF